MAVHAAMIDRMDQGVGRVLETVKRMGAEENTLVLFLSDNGASAEFLDSWPDPRRGHKPGTPTGAPGSHLGVVQPGGGSHGNKQPRRQDA